MSKRKPRRLGSDERRLWTLTPNEATAGVSAALENGRRLASDARLLNEQGRSPTALAIAILAVEELDKIGLITQVWHARHSPEKLDAPVSDFRNHRVKNSQMLVARCVEMGFVPAEIDRIKSDRGPSWAAFFEDLKHKHIYVDRTKDGWRSPSGIWPSEESARVNAEVYVRVAEYLVRYWSGAVLVIQEQFQLKDRDTDTGKGD